ncbi:hypothetical protein FM109_12390 [Vibrio casei]|nr:hypothetical protein FM109_12390 [Vibrio casei]
MNKRYQQNGSFKYKGYIPLNSFLYLSQSIQAFNFKKIIIKQ